MNSIFYLGLIIVSLLKLFYIIDADHCDEKTNAHLLQPKKDLNISLEEPDSCSISYLAILNPSSDPLRDDDCKIRGFHLQDGTIGPSCIPEIGDLKKEDLFSINRESHRKEAGLLLDVFVDCLTFEDFKNAALYYKSKVNPMLFSHVFSSAIINRDDTEAFSAPNLIQSQPQLLFNNKLIQQANQRIKNNEKKVLKNLKPSNKDFRKLEEFHEKAKYTRNEQRFDETKNNKNFRITTHLPAEIDNEITQEYGYRELEEVLEPTESKQMRAKPHRPSAIPNIKSDNVPIGQSSIIQSGPKIEHMFFKLQPLEPGEPRNIQKENTEKLPLIDIPPEENILILESDMTGSEMNPEQPLSYFREDISINSHHSHWHQTYPNSAWKRDRQGELFYYMHNQMLRRYDAARRAAGLDYVKPIEVEESGTIIEEGYYPHLSSHVGTHYSGRSRYMRMQDITFQNGEKYLLGNLVKWIKAVKKGIKDGHLLNSKKEKVKLDEKKGIDILGAVIESRQWSDKVGLKENYGDIHNHGHMIISYIHDAKIEYKAPEGVMYSTETALRDPVFWRWHKMVDILFDLHKAELSPYKNQDLTWEPIKIESFVIQTDDRESRSYKSYTCYTYFNKRDIEIGKGLDLASARNAVKIRMTHLDNFPFTYAINVHSTSNSDVLGHVRIFISPKYSKNNLLSTEEELRRHAIEMDRFTIKLYKGSNEIVRKSSESAVTMLPNEQWAQLSKNNVEFMHSSEGGKKCGCGWPSHLLLPKGNETGIEYVAFVMISNWDKEKVDNSGIERTCGDSLTMCGLLKKKFPDKRAMGFPLDRPFHGKKKWFHRPNMNQKDITIYHLNDINEQD